MMQTTPIKKHGEFWVIAPGQDTKFVLSPGVGGLGETHRTNEHLIPINTIEAPSPFAETTTRYQADRYFEPDMSALAAVDCTSSIVSRHSLSVEAYRNLDTGDCLFCKTRADSFESAVPAVVVSADSHGAVILLKKSYKGSVEASGRIIASRHELYQ